MIENKDKKLCCGCNACVQKCPQKCIEMKEDGEGFIYPHVNKNECANCNICNKVCPINNSIFQVSHREAYAAYSIDDELRNKSSSGGIFSLCAENVLNNQGVVFGAAFDEKFTVHHISIKSVNDLNLLQGSKYLQSRIENTYKEAEDILKKGIAVLYSGTACQIAGLKRYLKKDYDNLFTIDVLCHGVPSPKVWKKYIEEQEKSYKSNIKSIFFRSKKFGWKTYAVELKFNNSTAYENIFSKDAFMKIFLKNICLRPSCYDCKFKTLNRPSDLTIGDCWGIDNYMPEMDDDKGTSVLLIHSDKGKELFDRIKSKIIFKEGEIDKFKPQYLCEDLFGNASIFEKGLSIVWMDNEDFNKVRIMSSARINVKKIKGEATDRMWRFTNLDADQQ